MGSTRSRCCGLSILRLSPRGDAGRGATGALPEFAGRLIGPVSAAERSEYKRSFGRVGSASKMEVCVHRVFPVGEMPGTSIAGQVECGNRVGDRIVPIRHVTLDRTKAIRLSELDRLDPVVFNWNGLPDVSDIDASGGSIWAKVKVARQVRVCPCRAVSVHLCRARARSVRRRCSATPDAEVVGRCPGPVATMHPGPGRDLDSWRVCYPPGDAMGQTADTCRVRHSISDGDLDARQSERFHHVPKFLPRGDIGNVQLLHPDIL